MTMLPVERVAEAVLYEGYMLFPYRRSSLKNQQRWTFGGVYPRRYSEHGGGDDPWEMLTECLLVGDRRTAVEVKVRFLQVADRSVAQRRGAQLVPVEELRVGTLVHRPWEEAIERVVVAHAADGAPPRIGDLAAGGLRLPIAIPEGRSEEPLIDPSGAVVGALFRAWRALQGVVAIAAEPVRLIGTDASPSTACYRISVRIENTTPWLGGDEAPPSDVRHAAVRQTFVSTHTILHTEGGRFISLLEPPPHYQEAAARCTNSRTWPVLVGEPGEQHTLLSSPIILYDYPQVSAESQGDLFDATEIDELLTLSIITMTDEEKREMRESDPRTREILERTEALTPDQIVKLHASVRSLQTLRREER